MWFGIWTYRRLWRHPTSSPYDQIVYGKGVRAFGVFMFPLFAVAPILSFDDDPSFTAGLILLAIELVVTALIAWPASLWVGYWWGRRMARFAGLEHNDRPHN